MFCGFSGLCRGDFDGNSGHECGSEIFDRKGWPVEEFKDVRTAVAEGRNERYAGGECAVGDAFQGLRSNVFAEEACGDDVGDFLKGKLRYIVEKSHGETRDAGREQKSAVGSYTSSYRFREVCFDSWVACADEFHL